MTSVPRDRENDYTREAAEMRRRFAEERTGAALEHVGSYSFDPALTAGNIEHFLGVAQVPIGLAGPLLINGEHAQGEFYVPMATAEGTLVASYNRGMKLTRLAGGVTVTVHGDAMQRAPVFAFDNARQARDFGVWVEENFDEIAKHAEATTSSGKLVDIQQYSASRARWLRFNFTTGDAAGQNMVGKATSAACDWIRETYPGIVDFYLEGAFATDKKASQVNVMNTRGKRVTAEVVIPNELMTSLMHTTTERVYRARQLANVGGFMSGVNNNGSHSANGTTALFIATGQDAANVAESSAGIAYMELRDNDDYYYSITLPSLIVATYGGGTALATQRECLELLGCYGKGGVRKFAEIVAATVICGELSLSAAVAAEEWVSSHDQLGRNRK